jgi:hypothetical protein
LSVFFDILCVKGHIQNTVINTQYVTFHNIASTFKSKTNRTNKTVNRGYCNKEIFIETRGNIIWAFPIFRGKKKTKRTVKQTGSVMEKYAMLKLRENQLMEVSTK